jgi:hypothetical protein
LRAVATSSPKGLVHACDKNTFSCPHCSIGSECTKGSCDEVVAGTMMSRTTWWVGIPHALCCQVKSSKKERLTALRDSGSVASAEAGEAVATDLPIVTALLRYCVTALLRYSGNRSAGNCQ